MQDDGRYVQWAMIGQGATADVFRVMDSKIGTHVAVKILNEKAMRSKALQEAVANEVRISRQLHHSCICPIYDLYDGPNGFGTVMKMLSGCEMRKWMDDNNEDLLGSCDARLTLFRRLAEALTVAHTYIVHRDLKPGNIFLEEKDPARPVIMDFGISVIGEVGEDTPGGFTPKYMAPEQWEALDKVDARTDLFSLGVIAYELFTHRVPACSLRRTPKTGVVPRLGSGELEPPSRFNAGVHPAVDALIVQLMAYDQQDRPQSAREVAEALQAVPAGYRRHDADTVARERVRIEGGRGFLGSGPAGKYANEKPGRWVVLSPFAIDVYPVTNRDYRMFTERTGRPASPYLTQPGFDGDDQPVVGITFDEANAFAEWAGGYLPTEAQWECAAKAGQPQAQYPWGNEPPSVAVANIDNIRDTTTPVAAHPRGANAWGLHDMCGNVWEWCRDTWNERYYSALAREAADPVNTTDSEHRSLRGGSFASIPPMGRCSFRSHEAPDQRRADVGFRLVYKAE